MADIKITGYAELAATPDDADVLEIVDDVAGTPTSKKILVSNLHGGVAKASAAITDHRLIRGDGGVRGVQETTIIVSDNGEMTNPSQPCFRVQPTEEQSNIAVATVVTVLFNNEIFDVGSNFNISTYQFTAPVTGKYLLITLIKFLQLDIDATRIGINIVTSNRTYEGDRPTKYTADSIASYVACAICDMDVNDTAHVTVYQTGGAQQIDIHADSSFSGALIC